MRKSGKFTVIAAAALTISSLIGMSAFAETRHQDETNWRNGSQQDRYDRNDDRYRNDRNDRNDRDYVSGTVQRVDYRSGTVLLRERRSGRTITVAMQRRQSRRGVDLGDLRRGDYVTFVGDWSRGRVFDAWRIDSVDQNRGSRDRRW